ncbi:MULTISPECIES: response regulator transcription factor [unclassified Lentimonas]|uniref:response regulator transcription factor n=1 Tax=unclassified Lentimonas TaxID=2630993 RepID=UPI001323E97C|nr:MULTISPECIES: response regulator transcription factor [unclassified Lentimonas]CAA6692189.1 Unannotated [Lentimonas sp. CC19]CAA6697038.1 Unannotated [Lentimonas sp. CC10]CAA7070575.1 Unannotated [Lentimonas sp. CC11]
MQNDPSLPISVYIVEDHIDFREILCEALESTNRLQCIGAFSNVEDALHRLKKSQAPNIIILDLGLPGMDGIEAIPLLREAAPETQVLVLTVSENKTRVFQALGAGANGYLIKSDDIELIIQGIEDAYRGISPLSADIAKMVYATFSRFKPSNPEDRLTSREIEVIQALAKGMSRKEAADVLNISINTANTHIRTIYRKLHVGNVSGAVKRALEIGLI